MKKILLAGGFLLSFLFCCVKADASHCAGGEIQYQWVSDSTYHVIFKLYRDCKGNTAPNNVSLCYKSSCDNVDNQIVLQPLATLPGGVPNGSSVSTGCSGFPNACQNPNSTLPGYAEWWYAADVTLPFQCANWTFSVSISARNTSANLTGNSNNLFYVEATLNNLIAQGNSSPVFTVKPVPFVCINSPYTYNNGTNDPDGDSLHYSIISPQKGDCNGVQPIPFSAPIYNTTNNPIATNNTFVLDPITGQLSFVPASISASTLTLLVEEYRNHVLIGHTMRDIQVQTLNCNSVQPVITIDTPTLVGAPLVNGRIETCSNTPLNFCFKVTSPNNSAILVASDNHLAVAPGSTVSYVGQTTDSLTGCFSWIPTVTDTGLRIFTIIVKDSTCTAGIVISQSYVLPIYVYPVTSIAKDTTICGGNSVTLQATGGSNFVWTVLPGGSPLSTLSCTTCSNPVATPTITTSYVVTSTLISACNKNKDTVTIVVLQPPLPPTPFANTPVCRGASINLHAGTTALTYQWTGPAGFTSTLQNPVIANSQVPNSGTYQVVASNGMCVSAPGTVNVVVNPAPATPVITGNSPVCEGGVIELGALSPGSAIDYFWSGPNGYSAGTKNISISNATQAQAGVYTVQAGYPGNACLSQPTTYTVAIKQIAKPDFTLSRNPICTDDTVTINYTGTGATPDSVRWNLGTGFVINGSAGAGQFVVQYPTAGPQTITLVAAANGCEDSIKKVLNVQQSPSSEFHVNSEACLGEHLAVDAAPSVAQGLQYTWNFGPANVLDSTGGGRYYISYNTSGNQVITFQTRDALCSSLTTVHTVFVHPEPAAHILSSSRTDICTSDSIQLAAFYQPDYTYRWSPEIFFENDTMAITNAHVAYTGFVFLNVADTYGCKSKDSLFIHTATCCELTFPNAFTPNNDGHNDVFRVISIGHHSISTFRILNRWGQIVFETADERRAWDGTTAGEPQPSATYFYYIKYQCSNGQYYEQKGDVLLLR